MNIIALLFLLGFPSHQPAVGSLDDAILFYQKGEFKEAVSLLQQLRSNSPDDADVRLWLGKSYLKVRDWDNAVQEMEKSTQLQPSSAQRHLWLGRACGARAAHSFFVKALGWARRVAKEFEAANRLSPENLDIRFDLLDFYLDAPILIGGGKEKADAEAEAIAKLDPRKGYTARAAILSKEKKWDLAEKELIQATIEYPNDANAYKDVADFLLNRQDFEGALHYAKKALALNNGSKRSWLIMAAASTQLRTDLDYSTKALMTLASGSLADDDPAFEEVYYWLGEGFLATGERTKAREAFTAALVFNPDYGKAKEQISKLR